MSSHFEASARAADCTGSNEVSKWADFVTAPRILAAEWPIMT